METAEPFTQFKRRTNKIEYIAESAERAAEVATTVEAQNLLLYAAAFARRARELEELFRLTVPTESID